MDLVLTDGMIGTSTLHRIEATDRLFMHALYQTGLNNWNKFWRKYTSQNGGAENTVKERLIKNEFFWQQRHIEMMNTELSQMWSKFMIGMMALPVAVDIFGEFVIEELMDYAVEEVTGIPMVTSIADGVKTGLRKTAKFGRKVLRESKKASKKLFVRITTGYSEKNAVDLVNQIRKNKGGNVTVLKDGVPIFRVHKPGTHGAGSNEVKTTAIRIGRVNPKTGRRQEIDDATSLMTSKEYSKLKKAVEGKKGYSLRTKGGSN